MCVMDRNNELFRSIIANTGAISSKVHIPPTNYLLAAQQLEPYRKSLHILTKNTGDFLEQMSGYWTVSRR